MDLFSLFFFNRKYCLGHVLNAFYGSTSNEKTKNIKEQKRIQHPDDGCESVILGDAAGRVALKNLAFPIFACV